MKLLTKELRRQLPGLYAQEYDGIDAIAYVRFFTPDANWSWYATEFDGRDTCFGLVKGWHRELGYFRLSELETLCGPLGLSVERDLTFQPTRLGDLMG